MNTKIEQTQQQLDSVTVIMRENIEKVIERDNKISDLEDKSENLRETALVFSNSSRRLKNKMCFDNAKWWLLLFIILVIIITIIVVSTTQ